MLVCEASEKEHFQQVENICLFVALSHILVHPSCTQVGTTQFMYMQRQKGYRLLVHRTTKRQRYDTALANAKCARPIQSNLFASTEMEIFMVFHKECVYVRSHDGEWCQSCFLNSHVFFFYIHIYSNIEQAIT